MTILLDTHAFLWFISQDARLPKKWIPVFHDPSTEVLLSVVSVWEITLKYSLNRLPLPDVPERYVPAQRRLHAISSLLLDEESIFQLPALPKVHRDPFDRMLACQAIHLNLTIATKDPDTPQYPVKLLPKS